MSNKEIKIIAIGDVVGKPGRKVLADKIQGIMDRERADLLIVNGENSAGGLAITPEVYREIISLGANVVTTGNHVWNNREILQIIDTEERLLRPANYPPGVPGHGYCTVVKKGLKICIVNLIGRVMMNPVDCPFRKFDEIYEAEKSNADIFIVDFHAEATSEKQALGWYLDGRGSVVFGTHTHVQTADERILHDGTGYITDIGMTGSADSVIGMKKEGSLKFFLSQTRIRYEPAEGDLVLNGAAFVVDGNGRCSDIYRIKE